MKVSIEYCSVWNYLPKASGLEAELKSKYSDIEITLISSGGGVFEICLDDNLIFSKKALSRFPENNEIEKLINNSFGWLENKTWIK